MRGGGRRVCIVTSGHLATNPRVVKEANALVQAGYEVHVVHGHYAPWAARYDAALVKGFATTAVPFGPELAHQTTYVRQTLLRRSALALAAARPLLPAIAETAIAPIARDLAAVTSMIPADLYIAHYTPALPAVVRAARRYGVSYAFDAEDFHPGDLSDEPRHAREKALITAIERRALPGAAFVTAASPGIAEAYAKLYHLARPTVILNVFSRSAAPSSPTAKGTAQPGPSVYWFSQSIGGDRGLECAVRAIQRATSAPHLHLRGVPLAGVEERLLTLAAEVGVTERVHIHPPAPPQMMEMLAGQYDVGLVGETGLTPNRRIALTNKQFSYLLSGIPAVMSNVPAHVEFATEAEGAVFLYRTDDADSLAGVLDALLTDSDRLAAARSAAYLLGQERFNWEFERAKFLDVVAAVLDGGTPSSPVGTVRRLVASGESP